MSAFAPPLMITKINKKARYNDTDLSKLCVYKTSGITKLDQAILAPKCNGRPPLPACSAAY